MDTMLSGKSFLIGAVAQEAGTLGIEIADVAGSVEDVSSRMAKKTEIFAGLSDAAHGMTSSSSHIVTAAKAARWSPRAP